MCSGFIYEAALGHGSHMWLIPPQNFTRMTKTGWWTILFYQLSLWCSQVSILLLYIRIWTYPWIRRSTKGILVFVMIYKTIIIAAVATACIPLQAFWDFELQKRSYCHAKAVWWFTTYMHVITDFLTYLLPMPIIFSVQFPKRQKILLFILFAFGFFVCLVSLVCLYLLKITADTPDYTFDNVSIAFWSCVETNAAVSVACFITMKPLITRWFPTLVEERPDRAMQIALSNGRLPTIGSTPMRLRPAQLQRSLTASFRGYEVLAPDHRTKES